MLYYTAEKGKYLTETAVLDDEGVYTATILANELCDILVLEEEFFNTSIKVCSVVLEIQLSLVTRKSVFGVCHQVRLKPVCSATETS